MAAWDHPRRCLPRESLPEPEEQAMLQGPLSQVLPTAMPEPAYRLAELPGHRSLRASQIPMQDPSVHRDLQSELVPFPLPELLLQLE